MLGVTWLPSRRRSRPFAGVCGDRTAFPRLLGTESSGFSLFFAGVESSMWQVYSFPFQMPRVRILDGNEGGEIARTSIQYAIASMPDD